MNYKNIINFAIYCFVAVVFSILLVFLLSEIFGTKSIYDFLKDQGSLIAGIIGIIGVIAIIYFQIKTTKNLIESSKKILFLNNLSLTKIIFTLA